MINILRFGSLKIGCLSSFKIQLVLDSKISYCMVTIRLDALLQAIGFNCVHLISSNICVKRMDKKHVACNNDPNSDI